MSDLSEESRSVPVSYSIDPQQRLVTLTVVGDLDGPAIRGVERALTADPAYERHYDHILDVRGGRTLIGSSDVLREMAAKPIVDPGVRRAIVTGSLLAYGLARLFQATHDAHGLGDEVRVFRAIEDARAWLATPRAPKIETN